MSGGAFFVVIGIGLSRIAGLIRERAFAHAFGNSPVADAFRAALRIPNLLQNLLGEGVLSASLIPAYQRLRAGERPDQARWLAFQVLRYLVLLLVVLTVLGIFASGPLVSVLAPGFDTEKQAVTQELVRLFFPAVGLLVLSAWCIGVLNSHRRFFLSYSAPVIWNVAIIAFIFAAWRFDNDRDKILFVGWGVIVGSALQLCSQLCSALAELRGDRAPAPEPLRAVFRQFGPVVVGRGIVQISAYVDSMLASLLSSGAVAALAYAQTLYLLPISLFGMSVAVVELPEMSATAVRDTERVRQRLGRATRQVLYFIAPSTVAYILLGTDIIGGLLQSGRFTHADTVWVWTVLVGYTLGLPASTLGRLFASSFYALHDTRTPLKFSTIRVCTSIVLGTGGVALAGYASGRGVLSSDVAGQYGLVLLTLAATAGSFIEFALLRRRLEQEVGSWCEKDRYLPKVFFCAVFAGILTKGASVLLHSRYPAEGSAGRIASALLLLALFGVLYLVSTLVAQIEPPARLGLQRFRRNVEPTAPTT